MRRLLNTSAIKYFLEVLIKGAKNRLLLTSSFLKLNDLIKELLENKNRLKIDVASNLTPAAKQARIEFVAKSRFGPYFLCQVNFRIK